MHYLFHFSVMIRRPPTRIEMKLEDIHEYEKVKREAEASRRAANKAAAAGAGPSSSEGAAAAAAKTKREIIQERIGFVQFGGSKPDPTPKPST